MHLRNLTAILAGLTLTLLAGGFARAQPLPVEGTEMIPNEYGSEFPREITWGKDGSRMVLIPFGTFKQGLDPEVGGRPDEGPVREVYLPSFYIDKYEVSNRAYAKFRSEGTAPLPRPTGHPILTEPDHPVTAIGWNAAQSYARWAGKELPTEAMWEKAARGPRNSIYTTGNQPPDSETVIHGRGPRGETVPVHKDTGDVSGYGVYHMGGNVAEWTRDFYSRDAYKEGDATNPLGPSGGEAKVVRGGSYSTGPLETRATRRLGYPRTQVRDDIGFRTVWVPRPIPQEQLAEVTPTPTPPPGREEVLETLREQIRPYLERNAAQLPRELMASRVYTARGNDTVQFINFTPYRLSLNFLGPEHSTIFRYNEPLAPMTYRNVSLPREVDLYIEAWSTETPGKGFRNLGHLRAESRAVVLISSELFGPVLLEDGEEVPHRKADSATQFYTEYTPRWNEMEIHNALDTGVQLRIENITRDTTTPAPAGEYTMQAGEVLRLVMPPGRYRFHADYFGALEASSQPADMPIDDRAARRLLRIRQDPERSGGVTVITQEMPYLRFDVLEARRIARGN